MALSPPGHGTRTCATGDHLLWVAAGAAVPAAAAAGAQRGAAEGGPGAQEEDDVHRLGVHQQDPQPATRWTGLGGGGGGRRGPGEGSWGGWSLGRVVVTALCSRPAAREAVVWSMEQGHLQEKYQLFRQQVTEQHALQRQQLRRRHEKVRPGPGGHIPPTPGSSVTSSLLRPRAGHGAGAALPPACAGGAEEPAGPAAGPAAEKPALRRQNAPGPLQGQPEEPGGQRGRAERAGQAGGGCLGHRGGTKPGEGWGRAA